MAGRVIPLADDYTLVAKVEELTMHAVDRLYRPERQRCDATLAAFHPRYAQLSTVEPAVNAQVADELGVAARIGFGLGLSLASPRPAV